MGPVASSVAATPSVVGSVAPGRTLPTEKTIGELEPVFLFDGPMPTGVTVSKEGRIFVNFPRWGDDVPFTVGELRDGKVVPYPDAALNKADTARPSETLISVQSVLVDPANTLWLLDTAAPSFSPPVEGGPKLVAVDLTTNRVLRTLVLPKEALKKTTYLNDVRFDLRQGTGGVAYITDSGAAGLIVVDLKTGEAWRKLNDHSSTQPDPTFAPVVEGQPLARREKGEPPAPVRVASDGIAISHDGQTLYYSPLSSRHLFSVPTALLRDRSSSEETVARAVVDHGEKGASDGLESDAEGRLYSTDYEHNALRVRQADGQWTTLAHDPRLLWPDTLAVAGDGFLYVTANQLHRQPSFHAGQDRRQKPYVLFRLKVDATPVRLR